MKQKHDARKEARNTKRIYNDIKKVYRCGRIAEGKKNR